MGQFLIRNCYNRTRGNDLKLKGGRFILDIRKKLFNQRAVSLQRAKASRIAVVPHPWRHWWPGWMGPWAAWSSQAFKLEVGSPAWGTGVGAWWSWRSLPTQTVTWFYEEELSENQLGYYIFFERIAQRYQSTWAITLIKNIPFHLWCLSGEGIYEASEDTKLPYRMIRIRLISILNLDGNYIRLATEMVHKKVVTTEG